MYIGAYRYTNHIPMTADAPWSKLLYPGRNSDSPPQFRMYNRSSVELVNKLRDSGANIDVTVYRESHHSFDRVSEPIVDPEGYILTNCRYKMKDDGTVLTNKSNLPIRSAFFQKISLAFCTKRGPTYGGNIEARIASFKFSREFMKAHLLEPLVN